MPVEALALRPVPALNWYCSKTRMMLLKVPAPFGLTASGVDALACALASARMGSPGTAASRAAMPPTVKTVAIVTAPAIFSWKARSTLRRRTGYWATILETMVSGS